MDLWDLAKLMWRRWYLVAPMILLTLLGTTWAVLTLKPEYTSTGTIMLIPPADRTPLTPAELASTNSWVEVGEDLMATAVAISVNTAATRKEIEAAGFEPDYEVFAEDRSSIITIEVTAATAEKAQATVQRVQGQITHEVEEKQARFKPKPGRSITTQVLDGGDTIEVVTSKTKRAAVVIIGVGLLLTAAVTIVGDNVLRRRELQRRRPGPAERDEPAVEGNTDVIADRATERAKPDRASAKAPTKVPAKVPAQAATNGSTNGKNAKSKASGPPTGAGLTVAYRQAELDDRGVEPDDATIILPLGNTPWAGRDKDSEARRR